MQNMRRETLGSHLRIVSADYCVTCGTEIGEGRSELLAPGYLGFAGAHCCCLDCFSRAEAHCGRQAEKWASSSQPSAPDDRIAETLADQQSPNVASDVVSSRGEKETVEIKGRKPSGKFDRASYQKAYMRDYMRKYRRRKAEKEQAK
jgi:hypothetical protein